MNKSDRLHVRCTPAIKEMAKNKAQEQGISSSEYICALIENDNKSLTHEQQIEQALLENHLINDMLASDELPLKYKQMIGKEMKKYV